MKLQRSKNMKNCHNKNLKDLDHSLGAMLEWDENSNSLNSRDFSNVARDTYIHTNFFSRQGKFLDKY